MERSGSHWFSLEIDSLAHRLFRTTNHWKTKTIHQVSLGVVIPYIGTLRQSYTLFASKTYGSPPTRRSLIRRFGMLNSHSIQVFTVFVRIIIYTNSFVSSITKNWGSNICSPRRGFWVQFHLCVVAFRRAPTISFRADTNMGSSCAPWVTRLKHWWNARICTFVRSVIGF